MMDHPNSPIPPYGTDAVPPQFTPTGYYPAPPMGYPPPKQTSLLWNALKFLFFLCVGSVLLLFLFALLLGGMIGAIGAVASTIGNAEASGRVTERILSGSANMPHKVAVLPIEGMITENEDGFIRRAIRTAYEDPKVCAVVLRVNSPGGTISGSDYYYHLLREMKSKKGIPLVVSMGPMATSGGYYVSMAGDEILAERSTITGSIGVICMLFNGTGLCEKIGVSTNNIVSGPNKGMGDFTKPMTDGERAIWQGVVDDAYGQFLSVVRAGRSQFAPTLPSKNGSEADTQGANEADALDADVAERPVQNVETSVAPAAEENSLETIADGRIYTAIEAKELGLIDDIGFLDDAIEVAVRRAGVSLSAVQVVRYKKNMTLAEVFRNDTEGVEGRAFQTVQRLATPTVYSLAPGTLPVE